MASALTPQLAEELLRRLAASLRAGQLYSQGHPLIARNLEGLQRAVEALSSVTPAIVIGVVGDEVIVNDLPVPAGGTLIPLVHRLRRIGIERVSIDRGVMAAEIAVFAGFVASADPTEESAAGFPTLPHLRVGRVQVAERVEGGRRGDDRCAARHGQDQLLDPDRCRYTAGLIATSASTGRVRLSSLGSRST